MAASVTTHGSTTVTTITEESIVAMNARAERAHSLGDLPSAISLYTQVHAARASTLGASHPTTALAAGNLACALRLSEDAGAALPLYMACLPVLRGELGRAHPAVLSLLHGLAHTLERQRPRPATADAAALYRDVLGSRRRALGGCHSDTMETAAAYCSLLAAQGRVAPLALPALGALHSEALAGAYGLALPPPSVLAYAKLLYLNTEDSPACRALEAWIAQLKAEARGEEGAHVLQEPEPEEETEEWWWALVEGVERRKRFFAPPPPPPQLAKQGQGSSSSSSQQPYSAPQQQRSPLFDPFGSAAALARPQQARGRLHAEHLRKCEETRRQEAAAAEEARQRREAEAQRREAEAAAVREKEAAAAREAERVRAEAAAAEAAARKEEEDRKAAEAAAAAAVVAAAAAQAAKPLLGGQKGRLGSSLANSSTQGGRK